MISGFLQYFLITFLWLALTAALVVSLFHAAIKQAEIRFHVDADRIRQALEDKIRVNEAVLEGMAAFLGVIPVGEDQSTRNYAQAIRKRYPHIYMLVAQTRVVFSEREALLQAICPGNCSTSGTRMVSIRLAAAPHTPRSSAMRVHASGPWKGPRTSSSSF